MLRNVWSAMLRNVWSAMLRNVWSAMLRNVWSAMLRNVWSAMLRNVWSAMLRIVWSAMLRNNGAPCYGTCGAPCYGTCGAPCYGTCGAPCYGTCGAPCYGTCGAPCYGTCGAPCYGTCGAPCYGTPTFSHVICYIFGAWVAVKRILNNTRFLRLCELVRRLQRASFVVCRQRNGGAKTTYGKPSMVTCASPSSAARRLLFLAAEQTTFALTSLQPALPQNPLAVCALGPQFWLSFASHTLISITMLSFKEEHGCSFL